MARCPARRKSRLPPLPALPLLLLLLLVNVTASPTIWSPEKLLEEASNMDTLRALSSSLSSSSGRPPFLSCEVSPTRARKEVFASSRLRCGCRTWDARCRTACSQGAAIRQVLWAVGGSSGGGSGGGDADGRKLRVERVQGDWPPTREKAGGDGNYVVRFWFKRDQHATATFDSQLRLHGIFAFKATNTWEIRLFCGGLEVGPYFLFLGRGVLVKNRGDRGVLLWRRQWRDVESKGCEPLQLKVHRGGKADGRRRRRRSVVVWETKKVSMPTSPDSPEALLTLLDTMEVAEEEDDLEEDALEVPPHLTEEMATVEDAEVALVGLHSLQCAQRRYQPLRRFVAYQRLLDLSSEKIGPGQSFWGEDEFSSDPPCGQLANLTVPPPLAITKTNLVCFPGSGSRWIAEMVQFMAGYITGEKGVWLHKTHHDDNLNLIGAMVFGASGRPRPLTGLKERMAQLDSAQGRCILLLRNPYDAIASWWNHVRSRSHESPGLDTEELEESIRSAQFCNFSAQEATLWRNLALDYLTLCGDKLVVFYENVVRDYEPELLRILRFLRVPLGQDRLDCLRRHPLTKHKRDRSRKEPKEHFCERSRLVVESAVREVAEALQDHMLVDVPKEYY